MSAEGFLIAVDGPKTRDSIISVLIARMPEARKIGARSLVVQDHIIDIAKNSFSEPDSEDWNDWLWELGITPQNNDIDTTVQIGLARNLLTFLHEEGFRAIVCANFESEV